MKAIQLRITLREPLIASDISSGEENSKLSLSYIPGSMIRGLMIERYMAENKIESLLEDENSPAHRLFFSDAVCYLNGYPEVRGQHTLPTPASWQKEKGCAENEEIEIADHALMHDLLRTNGLKKEYHSSAKGDVRLFSAQKDLQLHIGGEERGVVKEGSAVFQYESLKRGQIFVSFIISEDADVLEKLAGLLKVSPIAMLGGSRGTGYGRVSIEASDLIEGWQEADAAENKEFTTVTFLSDALLRDQYGQPTLDLDAYLHQELEIKVKSKRAFTRYGHASGFNRKWKLPLPQSPVIGMGSVFVYNAGDLKPKVLGELAEKGIGERRSEGFGRIAINLHNQAVFKLSAPLELGPRIDFELSPASAKIAKGMAERLLVKRLDTSLLEICQKLRISGKISNHQLGRLRSVLRTASCADSPDISSVIEYLDNLRERARRQLHHSHVQRIGKPGEAGERLEEWIRARLEHVDALQKFMSISDARIPIVAGQKAELSIEIKQAYTLRLIEGLIDNAMKGRNGRTRIEKIKEREA